MSYFITSELILATALDDFGYINYLSMSISKIGSVMSVNCNSLRLHFATSRKITSVPCAGNLLD